MGETVSFWCYQCIRFVSISYRASSLTCPHCNIGFIQAVTNQTTSSPPSPPEPRRDNGADSSPAPFNPVMLLRSPPTGGDGGERLYQLYYHDGGRTGLRALPQSMSELLLGAGFDRLLEQLSQLEVNRSEKPPASKASIESMPIVEIEACHVSSDLECAVCYEGFVIGDEAREMPCQHLYHSHCIVSWLSIRNSCPICRHELTTQTRTEPDSDSDSDSEHNQHNNNEPIGLTIWRLPGGGYAVGRFSGGPVVYTEMDGGYNGNNNDGLARRVVWSPSRRNRGSGNGGMRRLFGKFVSVFRRFTSSSSIEPVGNSISRSRSVSRSSVFSRYVRRSRRLGHGRGFWSRHG